MLRSGSAWAPLGLRSASELLTEFRASFEVSAPFGFRSGSARTPLLHSSPIRAPLAADREVFLNHPLHEGSVLVAAGFLRKTSSGSNSNWFSAEEVLQRETTLASRRDA